MSASPLNKQWIDNLADQLCNCEDCSALQAVVTKIENQLVSQMEANAKQISALASLTIVPTNLTSVINYIQNQVSLYTQQYANALIAQAQLVEAYALLIERITQKQWKLNCSFPLPTIPTIPIPGFPPPLPTIPPVIPTLPPLPPCSSL